MLHLLFVWERLGWSLGGQLVMDAAFGCCSGKQSSPLEVEVVYMVPWVNVFYGVYVGPMAGSVMLSSPFSTCPAMRRWKLESEETSTTRSYQP